jgi:outer membrane receptor protein involved in Fe transport
MQALSNLPILGLLVLASIGTAFAQTAEEDDLALAYGDKSTISIATGSKQPITKAPSTATVITAEDIKAMGATDLDQVMETVPGVHVSRTANFYFSTYEIRGIVGNPTNPQVLMLQNGIPMNTLYRGDKGQLWAGLPLENIARIEVIRGPGSALYGADAFAGVINIITKTAADTKGTEFGARDGSFNTRNAWVQHGDQWGAVDVAASLNVGGTDGSKGIITQDAARLHCAAAHWHRGLSPPAITPWMAVSIWATTSGCCAPATYCVTIWAWARAFPLPWILSEKTGTNASAAICPGTIPIYPRIGEPVSTSAICTMPRRWIKTINCSLPAQSFLPGHFPMA